MSLAASPLSGKSVSVPENRLKHQAMQALAHQNLAIKYAQQGLYGKAIDEAKQALNLDPNSFIHQFNLAELLMAKGDVEEALTYYDGALKLNPHSIKALIGKSNCLCQIGDPLEALAVLEQNPLVNKDEHLQLQLSKTYLMLDDLDKAETVIQKLLTKKPSYEAKLMMAEIAFQRRNLPKAILISDELLKDDPSKSGAYLLLSKCVVVTRSGLLNAVDLVKSAKASAKNKALVFAQLASDFEKCASSISRTDPEINEKRYAWRTLARECFREAVKARPSDADIRHQFALSLRRNREFVQAYYQTEQCLVLDPTYKPALSLQKKLKQSKYDLFGWLKFYIDGGMK
jgi:tetratricopeptide (TPR) repeat protein